MDTSDLAKRMKGYERLSKTTLKKKEPVIIRIDGKAFHTFTKGFEKPFDALFIQSMQETMKYLCENIQGCVLGYHQSDEITLVLVDYQKEDTSAYFDYEVQKLCSIIASMATMKFNQLFCKNIDNFCSDMLGTQEYRYALCQAADKGAMFDARCFNLPKEEVTNCLYWRQLDAMRNSIQMVGQTFFSQKELHGKTCNDIKEMLINQKNTNWELLPTHQKKGSCAIRTENGWKIDLDIPTFKGEGREYIEQLILFDEPTQSQVITK